MIEPQSLEQIEKDPATAKTQLVIVTGLLVLAWIFDSIYLVYASGITGLLCFIPAVGNRIVWGWFKLAEYLGWFNARVLLSLVYYLIVTPIGFIFRLAGNDPLLLRDKKKSIYTSRNHSFKKEDLENPW